MRVQGNAIIHRVAPPPYRFWMEIEYDENIFRSIALASSEYVLKYPGWCDGDSDGHGGDDGDAHDDEYDEDDEDEYDDDEDDDAGDDDADDDAGDADENDFVC